MQNQNKQLLTESLGYLQLSKQQLTESYKQSDNGLLIIPTLLSTADERNGNGRIYPYSVLKESIERYMGLKNSNELYGSLDHYDDAEVKYETVSHKIVDTWWKGNKLYGNIAIYDFPEIPQGQRVAKFLKLGDKVGVSSRSLGNTSQRGDDIIVESLDIIAYDLVTRNSNHGSILGSGSPEVVQENIVSYQVEEQYSKLNHILNQILGR
jgi:hypothetical protein